MAAIRCMRECGGEQMARISLKGWTCVTVKTDVIVCNKGKAEVSINTVSKPNVVSILNPKRCMGGVKIGYIGCTV